MEYPSGTVTFLFTDIEGSTKLAQEHPDEMPALLARHHEILKQSIQAQNGFVFQIVGDSFSAAFHSAGDALNAALNAQRNLQNESWNPAPIKVRMGIHTGTAKLKDESKDIHYEGYATLALTQRIMSAGHGGQILLSNAAQQLVRDDLPDGLSLRDMGEHRLKDLIRPERLCQLINPNLPADFPPLKTQDVYRHNLPTQLTSFIGRGHEINEITKLITEQRVVTLTGSGGAGKTRLSLQVGAECLEQFSNGVWFVELASLTEPSLIVGAIMSVLGLHEKDNDIHALAKYIGDQSLLLILDNCEHLIEDCARLVEVIIQSCPNLRVLASSREAFGIAGEHPYRVPSLPFPGPKHMPTLDEIAACESVQLFIERVKTFVPVFTLTEKNASFVAQICCGLDGIPLALELAAARVKVMSVEQMAARLRDIFNLLTSGNRTVLPRQQTLRALIEWSYDLLSESEKSLFRRLAAFSGGWSLEAAESICGVEGSGAYVLDDLARLVDKSLVVKEEHEGEARFHMLETIRQYAEFKMFASEEVDDVKNRHRDWFMQLAEEAEPKLRTGEQMTWLNQLELEHDNLRAAMNWSMEQKHIEQALRIPSALTYFWEIHGHGEEGRNWFDDALKLEAQNNERKYPYAWATAVVGLFSLSWFLPNPENHKPPMEEALDIFRRQQDAFRIGRTLYSLASFPNLAGNHETAKSTWYEGLDAYQTINDQWGIGECLHCIAHMEELQGNTEEAHTLFSQSLEVLKPIGDRYSLFHPAGDTAVIALYKGELNTAKMILEESIQTFGELKNREWTSISINRLTQVLYEQGEYENARKVNQRNLEVMRETNDLNQISWSIELKGRIELAEGNLSSAHQLLDEALAISEKNNNQFSVGFLKTALGLIDYYEGNFSRGKERIGIGIEKVRGEHARESALLLTYQSHALWLEKDLQGAAESYRNTIKELQHNYYFIRIPECLEGLGKIAIAQDQLERGAHLFGAAEALREKMGTPIPPVQRGDYDAHVQSLGPVFESSWRQGHGMTMDEIIGFALEENAS